jgi:hypothetical protein
MLRTLLAAGIAAVAFATLAAPALADHAWSNYHWARTANPFTVKLGDNVTNTSASNWEAALARASSDWSASSVLDAPVVPGNTTGRQCKPTDGMAQVCNAKYGRNGWLGLAQIWISGVHIVKATTKVNDTYLESPSYDATAKQHVMCQEVGHDFGLGHQDESGADLNTCMDYADALDNPSPNAHDYEQLETIYNSHLDSSSTVQSFPENASPVAVERLDRIKSSTITEDFGNGFRRVTFIHWAVPGR